MYSYQDAEEQSASLHIKLENIQEEKENILKCLVEAKSVTFKHKLVTILITYLNVILKIHKKFKLMCC